MDRQTRRPCLGNNSGEVPHSISDRAQLIPLEARSDHHGIDVSGLGNKHSIQSQIPGARAKKNLGPVGDLIPAVCTIVPSNRGHLPQHIEKASFGPHLRKTPWGMCPVV